MGFGGPVWHASIAPQRHGLTTRRLRKVAMRVLDGVGDRKHEWEEWTGKAYHIRRRMAVHEAQHIGCATDMRRTAEARKRAMEMGPHLARIPRDMLSEEVGLMLVRQVS
jgi:hypothetical protein